MIGASNVTSQVIELLNVRVAQRLKTNASTAMRLVIKLHSVQEEMPEESGPDVVLDLREESRERPY